MNKNFIFERIDYVPDFDSGTYPITELISKFVLIKEKYGEDVFIDFYAGYNNITATIMKMKELPKVSKSKKKKCPNCGK